MPINSKTFINYHTSHLQVLESDKKIKALSLVKFSQFTLQDVDDYLSNNAPSLPSDDQATAEFILSRLEFTAHPNGSDANIIYYVAGYVCRSVVRTNRCDACSRLLVDNSNLEVLQLDDNLGSSSREFLDSLNRGGLKRPTDYSFNICVASWIVFQEIKDKVELKKVLLGATNQRALFTNIVERAMTQDYLYMDDSYCEKGHNLKINLIHRFFNCLAKNMVKIMTAETSSSVGGKRKAAKLCSKVN